MSTDPDRQKELTNSVLASKLPQIYSKISNLKSLQSVMTYKNKNKQVIKPNDSKTQKTIRKKSEIQGNNNGRKYLRNL